MKISELADQVRGIPLRDVLEHYGFEVRPEGTTLRAKNEHHNIVVTGNRWFDNKAGVGGGGAIDLVIHLAKVNFSAACRCLAMSFFHSQQARQRFLFLRAGKSPSIPRRNPLRNWRHSTRCGRIPIGRLPEPTLLNSARFRRHWWTNCTLAVRSTPMIIGPIRALFFSTATSMAKCAEPLFGIPNISPYSAGALEIAPAWFAVGDLAKADRIMAVESPIDALSYYSLFGAAALRWRLSVAQELLFLESSCFTHTLAAKPSSSLSITTPQANAAGKRHGTKHSIGRLRALLGIPEAQRLER